VRGSCWGCERERGIGLAFRDADSGFLLAASASLPPNQTKPNRLPPGYSSSALQPSAAAAADGIDEPPHLLASRVPTAAEPALSAANATMAITEAASTAGSNTAAGSRSAASNTAAAAGAAAAPPAATGSAACGASREPVIVVGAGPAGLFAALTAAEAGLPVVLVEKGQPVEQRGRDIGALFVRGKLNPDSNLCYGAGVRGLGRGGALRRGGVGDLGGVGLNGACRAGFTATSNRSVLLQLAPPLPFKLQQTTTTHPPIHPSIHPHYTLHTRRGRRRHLERREADHPHRTQQRPSEARADDAARTGGARGGWMGGRGV